MGRTGGEATREKILRCARKRVAVDGFANLTLDAVAEAVGVTKQAVLYHFGSKRGLLVGLWLAELEREVAAVNQPLAPTNSAAEGIEAFITAAVDHYLADLDRYRILYVANQTARQEAIAEERERREEIYPNTSRLYDTLEAIIRADPTVDPKLNPRRLAVGAHFTALGIAAYMAMLDAAGDTLKHDPRTLARELADLFARGLGQ